MKPVKTAILLLSALAWNTAAAAGETAPEAPAAEILRPVASAYMAGAGGASLLDTYLTPIKYRGWGLGLSYERMQAMKFDPERWTMRLAVSLEMAKRDNPSGNAAMWYGSVGVSWGMTRRWRLPYGIILAGGASASLDGGCLYNRRNSNNPASAKAALTANLTGSASWTGKIGRLPLTVRYTPTLPVVGAFFSPDYGELYYEIYLGNRSGLAHAAWWKNYFRMENLFSVDLHLSRTSLRIGYRGGILSTKINSLTTRIITNSFLLGVSGEWLGVSPRKKISPEARIISAVY